MENKYIISFCFVVTLLLCFKTEAQVYNYYTVPAVGGGTSGNGRGPVTSFAAHRSCAIYKASEFTGLINNGDSIGSVGFIINTNAITAALTGNIKIYMVNTTDTTYLKSTTWSTLLTTGGAMDTVYDGTMIIPAAAGPYWVNLTTPFKYTGGGIYLAYEWTVSTPSTGTSIYSCNYTGIPNGQKNVQGASLATLGTLTGTSNFRAQLYLGVKAPTNDAAIVELYSLGKLPIPFAVPHTVKARVKNNGADTLLGKAFYLTVGNINVFSDSVVIDSLFPGQEMNISFASYTSMNTGTDTVRVFCSPDNGNGNNLKTYIQIVNLNTYNYADPGKPTTGGVGFTGATGNFVAKFPYTGSNSINQIGVNFSAGGNSLKVGIWDTTAAGTPGTLLWSSANFSTLAGLNTIPVNPPVAISGTFYVGVIQTGTANASFSYQAETPIRGQTFYYSSPTTSTTWTDFLTTASNFRFMIEPRLQLANDLGSTSIDAPCNSFPLGQGSVNPIATFYNYGSNTQFSLKLRAKIYNASGAVVYNDSSSLSFILPSVSETVTFTSVFNPTLAGTYTIKTWSELIGDGDRNNDTATKTFTVQNMNTGLASGNRIQFDGTDDYVMIPNAANIKPNTDFTVEAWVRPSSIVSIGTLYSKDSTTSDSSLTIYMVGATPQVVMRTANGSVALMASSSGSLFSWTHVAVTYDGINLRIYVNGDTAGVASITGAVTCLNGPTYLGRRAGATLPANLGLENFMFWNIARTESQIRLGMHTKVPALSSTNLMAYLRFDEGPGNLYLADASGNCNEALMNNFDQATCWFQSSLPLDTTLGTSIIFTNDNLQSFANKNLAFKFSNLSGSAQVVAHYFKYLPLGFLPDTVIATTPKVSHNRHWAIYRYGSNSYDSVRASFTFPSGNLGASGTAANLYLTVRDNGASGVWTTARNPADSLDIFNQTAQFWLPQSISIKKQFGIASSGSSNPLPVKYLSFNGFKQQSGVKLVWVTASEINNAHFVIERSIDGKNFDAIGKVKGAGNSQQKLNYSFMDMNVFSLNASKIYYRLKQFDVDGSNENSEIVIIEMDDKDIIFVNTILPNPFSNKLELSFTSSQEIHMVIEIININGELMFSKTIDSEAGYRQINLDEAGDMPHGVYFMRLQYNGIVNIQKLLKLAN